MTTHKQVRSTEEALTLALELLAVGTFHSPELQAKRTEVIEQGLNALAQPAVAEQHKQEPTWWLVEYHDWAREFVTVKPEESIAVKKITAFYTTPPTKQSCSQRSEAYKPLPLTDEQISMIAAQSQDGISPHDDTLRFARAIEAAHGIVGDTHE